MVYDMIDYEPIKSSYHSLMVRESVPQGNMQYSSTGGSSGDNSVGIRDDTNLFWGALWMTGIIICGVTFVGALIVDLGFLSIISYIFFDFFICSVTVDPTNPSKQGCRYPDPNEVRAAAWSARVNSGDAPAVPVVPDALVEE